MNVTKLFFKVHARRAIVVCVFVVPATSDDRRVVDHHNLIMHPLINAFKLEQHIHNHIEDGGLNFISGGSIYLYLKVRVSGGEEGKNFGILM